jgi:hypothetical protein
MLMPLQDNPVNRCKSDVKLIEAACAGAVALASPTVYEATLRDGETGLLFRDSGSFESQLATLLGQPALRERLALAAREYARRHRMLADRPAGRVVSLACGKPRGTDGETRRLHNRTVLNAAPEQDRVRFNKPEP